MNRIAQPPQRPLVSIPSVLAQLDLADEKQRRVHDLVQRFHGGRWPLFRALGMRQIDGVLVEAVQWHRMTRPSFSLVEWHRDGYGLSWHDFPTRTATLTALRGR